MQKLNKEEDSALNIRINGRIPSKKNSRNLFVRGGKLFNIPSKDYAAWHKLALLQIKLPKDRTLVPSRITLSFWAPDKRASDLTNKAESIMDLLVDAKVIEDDNWWVIKEVKLQFMGVDKENPRCEILLY